MDIPAARRRCLADLSHGDRADPGLASVRGLDWLGPNRRREGCIHVIKLTDSQLVLLGAAGQRKGPLSRRPSDAQGRHSADSFPRSPTKACRPSRIDPADQQTNGPRP
jgi:hypothetical protein